MASTRTASGLKRRPSGEPPPLPRELNTTAAAWVIALLVFTVVWVWIFLSDDPVRWITEVDLNWMEPIVDNRQSWLTSTMLRIQEIGVFVATPVVGWTTIVVGLAARRIRHVLLLIASLSLVATISTVVSVQIARPRPLGVSQLGHWEGFAQPSRPVALLSAALVGAGLTLTPLGRWRRWWMWTAAGLVSAFGLAQIYVGVDHPTDVLAATTVGVAITLVLYRGAAPEAVFPIAYRTGKSAHLDVTGARGKALRLGLQHQLGIVATSVTHVGLKGSAGSTPLRITQDGGADLFGKLYASNHLRADRSYKLFRTLRYGRLEDERHFTSVRRLVQHEDYMLRVMRQEGIDTMQSRGIVEITPDREYLLVSEFIQGQEISRADITPAIIDAGLETVAQLWKAGLAHRDIKPANILVAGDRLRLIDVSFAEIRPSPWRQAVDLANMMLVLALGSSPEIVYQRALDHFTEEEIAEAFAASRGMTLPSGLRADLKQDGRTLLEQFRALAPERKPVAIQRWSWRRAGLTLWVALITALLAAIFLGSLPDIGLV